MPYEVLVRDTQNNAWRIGSSGEPLAQITDPRGLMTALNQAETMGWRVIAIGDIGDSNADEILLQRA